MDEATRLLARSFADIEMYRRLLAIMPWAVHVDHDQRRALERATRIFARTPEPRREFALTLVHTQRRFPWAG